MRYSMGHSCRLLGAAVVSLFAASTAAAIDIAFTSTSLTTVPGGSVVFTGRITNDTAFALNTSQDLFMNFSSYNPLVLFPVDLIEATAAIIPAGAMSSDLQLFRVNLSPSAPLGVYPLQASLQDVFASGEPDSSPVYNLSVSAIPEPSVAWLLLPALPLLGLSRRRLGAG